MPHDQKKTVTGQITDVFFHRFVVKTAQETTLADIGPKAAEAISLKIGDKVELTGEMKPSELKVHKIAVNGGQPVDAHHPDKHEDADPMAALKTAKSNGFTVLGEARRKPKHFEILGRDGAGDLVELHIELDGHLRKTKPVDAGDDKWQAEIKAA